MGGRSPWQRKAAAQIRSYTPVRGIALLLEGGADRDCEIGVIDC